jgi:hypothetical protein
LFKKTVFTAIISGLAMICIQPNSLLAASSTSLAGSWHLVYMPTSPNEAAAIPGLATFTTDGSTIETDGAEVAPGSVSSGTAVTYGTPGHGIWELVPSGTAFYIQFDSLNVNADGSLNSRRTTTMTITLSLDNSGGSFSGQYTTTVVGASPGNPITTSGNIKGQLIPPPALP